MGNLSGSSQSGRITEADLRREDCTLDAHCIAVPRAAPAIGPTPNAELKIRIEPVVFEHSLVKIWRDDDNRAGVRPDAIEMGIYYGDQLIDRVVLGDGVWTYKWTSEEEGDTYCYISDDNVRKYFKPGDDDNAWAVREFTRKSQISDSRARAEAYKLAYYSPEYEKNTSDTMESFIVNNPYSDKGRKLPDVDTGDTNNIMTISSLVPNRYGISGATSAEKELFGTDRMLAALNRNPDATPKELLKTLQEDIDAFVDGAPQFDDITMLNFCFFGTGGESI